MLIDSAVLYSVSALGEYMLIHDDLRLAAKTRTPLWDSKTKL